MTLEQLRIYVKVIEAGSFTDAAAKKLQITEMSVLKSACYCIRNTSKACLDGWESSSEILSTFKLQKIEEILNNSHRFRRALRLST